MIKIDTKKIQPGPQSGARTVFFVNDGDPFGILVVWLYAFLDLTKWNPALAITPHKIIRKLRGGNEDDEVEYPCRFFNPRLTTRRRCTLDDLLLPSALVLEFFGVLLTLIRLFTSFLMVSVRCSSLAVGVELYNPLARALRLWCIWPRAALTLKMRHFKHISRLGKCHR